ncbi:Mediator of RNA polymerase II transcription subunit 15a [Zea mays]|uniref:Mediator of RNA polymerase II transcription subunit 15a n=1 Tax=Zea mays TaxID=4577 RepID=A0A1D6PYM3_MAIZE|nr:Mediator of RNA polymerase II transcription subunit 15a [Zea mays]AQK51536.1 Mediator of RNA polymerase II transcription subunit 15a [Zea mays]AQK51539.1 Mediator of RNA polymerase II transcription subunit 15a [Zea mays]AQK51541.1 Mediator of RNA polymerase II transcription subunit 15a [Zea mays]
MEGVLWYYLVSQAYISILTNCSTKVTSHILDFGPANSKSLTLGSDAINPTFYLLLLGFHLLELHRQRKAYTKGYFLVYPS